MRNRFKDEQSSSQINSNEDLIKLSKRLKTLRKAAGYSSPKLFAIDHEINPDQYIYLESGIQDIKLSSLFVIIRKLGLNVKDFFNKDYENPEI